MIEIRFLSIIGLNFKFISDVDECKRHNGGCEHTCVNSIGGFRCACDAGYHLMTNGLSCDQGVTSSVTAVLVIYGLLLIAMAVAIIVLFCSIRKKGGPNSFQQMS